MRWFVPPPQRTVNTRNGSFSTDYVRLGYFFLKGRPDSSGNWLYGTLHRFGFASRLLSLSRDDGMKLKDCYITAALRCVPPANRPTAVSRSTPASTMTMAVLTLPPAASSAEMARS